MRPNSFSDVRAMPMWGLTAGQFSNVPSPRIPDSGLSSSSNVYVSEGRLRVRPSLVEYAPTNRQVPCSHVAHMITQDGIPYLMRTTTDPATGEVQVHAWDGSSWTPEGSPPLHPDGVDGRGGLPSGVLHVEG